MRPTQPTDTSAKRDPVYGTGATLTEKNLARGTALIGTAAIVGVVLLVDPDAWQWWQYVVAAILAFDLVGGVVANGLNSAKREHFGTDAHEGRWLSCLVRRPVAFAALHVQPILAGLLFPGGPWWWGVAWYLTVLLGVVAVRRSPLYLRRPVALAVCAAAAIAAPVVPAPVGLAWLPVILTLKLVLAHAVDEEAYRRTAVGP